MYIKQDILVKIFYLIIFILYNNIFRIFIAYVFK